MAPTELPDGAFEKVGDSETLRNESLTASVLDLATKHLSNLATGIIALTPVEVSLLLNYELTHLSSDGIKVTSCHFQQKLFEKLTEVNTLKGQMKADAP